VAGDGVQRRPAAVDAAAREKAVRWRNAGQQASARASLGAREANMAAGRRRARAAAAMAAGGSGLARGGRQGLLYAARRVRG
jgi:hypothetical protein